MMKWVLREIFERVARGQSAVLRVVFADSTAWQGRPGEPEITILFRTRAAERRTVLLGYVGFFEAYFDGDINILGDRAVGGLMRMAFCRWLPLPGQSVAVGKTPLSGVAQRQS